MCKPQSLAGFKPAQMSVKFNEMKTIEINLYKFSELSREAQKFAVERWNESETEYLHFFSDNITERLEKIGFSDVRLQYSLNYCQGDGLSFSANAREFIERLIKRKLGKGKNKTAQILADNMEVICKGNEGRYCFAHKNDVDIWGDDSRENTNEYLLTVILPEYERIYLALCKRFEKWGYDEIKYEQSFEAVSETIKANDYDFLESGELYS